MDLNETIECGWCGEKFLYKDNRQHPCLLSPTFLPGQNYCEHGKIFPVDGDGRTLFNNPKDQAVYGDRLDDVQRMYDEGRSTEEVLAHIEATRGPKRKADNPEDSPSPSENESPRKDKILEVVEILEDAQIINDGDAYFLQCVQNAPNLYDQNHDYYTDDGMRSASWGMIAKNNAMTRAEAIKRWDLLLKQFSEEENLVEAQRTITNPAEIDISFPHYKVMKEMLTIRAKKKFKNEKSSVAKKRKTKCATTMIIEETKLVHERVQQGLANAAKKPPVTASNNPNLSAGKIVFKELQNVSPRTANRKRSLICQRLFGQVSRSDENLTES